jgi:hypothetical protein
VSSIRLTAAPTWRKEVVIPTPEGDLKLEVDFRHKTRAELQAFRDSSANREDVDVVMEIVAGWVSDVPFNRDEVAKFLEDRHQAAMALAKVYMMAYSQAVLGN